MITVEIGSSTGRLDRPNMPPAAPDAAAAALCRKRESRGRVDWSDVSATDSAVSIAFSAARLTIDEMPDGINRPKVPS